MRELKELWVIHRHVSTSFKWGATRSNTIKLFRVDGKVPVFSTQVLAYTYLAGYYRPTGKETHGIRTVSWPARWRVLRHDWFVEKREMKITKIHVVDPKPPQEPMADEREKP